MAVPEDCRGKEGIGPPLGNKHCRAQTSFLGTRNPEESVSRTKELGGFSLLGGSAGKLALRPPWEKNPAALWIIKGFPGPSGKGPEEAGSLIASGLAP